jgi:hypothetical protein
MNLGSSVEVVKHSHGSGTYPVPKPKFVACTASSLVISTEHESHAVWDIQTLTLAKYFIFKISSIKLSESFTSYSN